MKRQALSCKFLSFSVSQAANGDQTEQQIQCNYSQRAERWTGTSQSLLLGEHFLVYVYVFSFSRSSHPNRDLLTFEVFPLWEVNNNQLACALRKFLMRTLWKRWLMLSNIKFVLCARAVWVFAVIDILDQHTALCVLLSGKKLLTMTEHLPQECELYLSHWGWRVPLFSLSGKHVLEMEGWLSYCIHCGRGRLWKMNKSFIKLQWIYDILSVSTAVKGPSLRDENAFVPIRL